MCILRPVHHANEELCTLVKTSLQMQRQQGEGTPPVHMEACTPLHFRKKSKPCSPPTGV